MPVAGTRNTCLASAAPLAWETNRRLPRGVAAVLAALRFSAPSPELLQRLSDAEWKNALAFTDRSGLTLILGTVCRDYLPAWVRERIERDLANNTERIGRLRAALVEVIEQLNARGIEHLLIKGLAQEVDFVSDPYLRVGYDIDLFAPPGSLVPARETIESLGYEAVAGSARFPADHVPPMIRKTGWQWDGDYYDPGIPPCIDLHFRFWDPVTEGFPAPGVEDFWARRIHQDGLPVLGRADRLAYSALHLLRHVFRGTPRPYHVYEIAYFLDTHAADDSFWNSWSETHPPALRRLEAIAFRLARVWFGCRLAPFAAEAADALAPGIQLWFEHYAAAPLEAQFHPNKDELWLQFELLDSPGARAHLFVRRLLPATMPLAAANAYVPDDQLTWRLRIRGAVNYASHVIGRALYHVRAVPPVIAHGLLWKSRTSRLPAPFWRLLGCSLLYFLGMYQFALLYNLYLLDLGYRENVLGLIASAFTAGCFAGVLPAAGVANRWGLKRSLVVGIAGTAAAFALRAVVSGEPALLATAFAGGALFSLWNVVLTPAVAAVTPESARPAAYSFTIGSGIALGMAAAVLGGHLPGWFADAGLGSSAAQSKQFVMLAGSLATALALWPLRRLRIESEPARETVSYPRGLFIRRFLLAIGVWNLATGAFNPLFNAYFAREFRMPVERIGLVFSLAQAAQVIAIFCAPVVLRRLGLTRGVAAMQLATALALALLAPAQVAIVAAILYTSYMSFQYMSEPGIYSSLMNRVLPGQRSGASALNYLVLFGAQTLAATLSGGVVARYGYPPMLVSAALLAIVAAWLFWRLPQEEQ
ncbi:MAG TPA: MFS transporter [Bryobacteraceae bacterium]|nr:MFS transporter [Bryobacteraceae bacterium]